VFGCDFHVDAPGAGACEDEVAGAAVCLFGGRDVAFWWTFGQVDTRENVLVIVLIMHVVEW
jgi:hypothetical protein